MATNRKKDRHYLEQLIENEKAWIENEKKILLQQLPFILLVLIIYFGLIALIAYA